MSNGRRGKLVLQEVPTGQVEKKVVRLLLQFAKSASVEQLTQKVRRTPYTISNDIEAEKAALIIGAFEKFGAMAAFVPHAPAEPVAEWFTPVESEPRFVMRPPAVSKQSASGGTIQPQSPKPSVRNIVIFFVFILMMLSFGFLAWQLWPVVKGEIQGWVSYLKQLF
jgi:hypothetical protein